MIEKDFIDNLKHVDMLRTQQLKNSDNQILLTKAKKELNDAKN